MIRISLKNMYTIKQIGIYVDVTDSRSTVLT